MVLTEYCRLQVQAGADVIQIFDSWVGSLGLSDYRDYAFEASKRLVRAVQEMGVPVIYFGVETAGLLTQMAATGADVIGLDWRQPLDEGWREVGHAHAVQGNLDPITLFAPVEILELRVKEILRAASGRPGHIFNLGHGIVPQTPVENVQAVVRMVREFRLENAGWLSKRYLLLAHGTPETVEQIPEYLRNVVSGRPLPEHVVEEIQAPLCADRAQSADRDHARAGTAGGSRTGRRGHRRTGLRRDAELEAIHSRRCAQMRADGVEQAAVICMAPQNSRTSVGLYKRAVQAEAGALKIDFTEGWAQDPLLADAFAERLRAAEESMSAETGAPVPVLFTAHSVPSADGAGTGRRTRRRAEALAGRGRRSLRRRGQAYGGACGRARARDSAVVVCFPEPGRKRRSMDRADRGGNARQRSQPRG